jgi:hypothetical protein
MGLSLLPHMLILDSNNSHGAVRSQELRNKWSDGVEILPAVEILEILDRVLGPYVEQVLR